MANKNLTVRLKVTSRSLERQLEGIVAPDSDLNLITADNLPVDLMFFELSGLTETERVHEFSEVQAILAHAKAREVFLVGEYSEPAVLLKAIKIGAREFITLPLKEDEVKEAIRNFKERQEKVIDKDEVKDAGKIFTVIGSKGGTGTTTVAVNMAVKLAEEKNVILLDMNQVFGEIPHFLDMKTNYSWGEIIRNANRLDSTFLLNILAKHSSGVSVLPSPSYLADDTLATPEIIERLLDIVVESFDCVVIDAGQSLDSTALKILELSDMVYIVTILSVPGLANTNKLISSFRALGYPSPERYRVIINRYIEKSSISLEDAENAIENEIYWKIPNDYATTVSAINRGKPIHEIAPKAPIAQNFAELSDLILERKPAKVKKSWWRRS